MSYEIVNIIKTETIVENGLEYEVTTYDDGDWHWRLNDEVHREKGPAIIHKDGYKEWNQNGYIHRLDGPAAIFPESSHMLWYINNKKISEQSHTKIRTILSLGLNRI